ncbi:MAG: hypothetical protein VB118_11385, partial [Oscillospiraceae bacterium]|nr:hypothetical protein [Oscillospiraceae bacterium]
IEGFVPYPYGIYDVFVSSGENGVDTYKLTIPEARSELFTCHASGNESKEAMFDVTNKATYKDAVIAERFALPRTSSDELNAEIIKDFFEFADKNAVFSDKREELAYYVNYNIRRTYGLERIEVHYITFDEYGKKSDEIKKYFCETTTGAYWKDGDVEPEDIIKTLALNFADRLQMFVGDVSAERPLKCDIYSIAAAMYLCKRTAIDPVSTTYYSPQEMNITNYETERIFVELLGIDFVLPEENQRYKSEGNLYITLGDEKSRFSMGSVSTVLNRSLSEIKIIGNRVTVDAVCEYAARFGFSYGKKAMRYEFEFDGLELKLISARTEKSINDPEPVTVKLIEKSPDGKYASFDDAVRAELVFDNTEDISFSESLKKQICDFALAYKNIAGSCLSTESIDSIPYNDFTFNSGFRIESCCFNCTLDNGNKVWLYTLSAIRSTTDNKYNVYIIKIDVFTDEDPTYISLSDDGIKAVLDNDPRFCGTYNERHLVCDGWKNVDFGTIIKEAGYDKVLAYCGFNNKDALPYIAVIAGKSITEKLDGKFILYYKNVTLMFYNIETGLFSEKCIELKDIQNILGYSLKSDDDYLYIILTTKNGDEEQKIKYCLKYNGSSDPKLIEGEPKIVFEGDSNAYYITSIIETEKWVIERDSGGSIYTTRKSDGEKKTLYSSIPYKYGERGTSAQLYSIISEKYLIYQIFGWEWSVGFGVFNLETEKNWVVECGAYLHEIFGEYIILQDNDELKYAKVTAPFVQFLLIDNLWEYDSVYIDSEMKRFFVSPESSGYKAYLFEVYYFERTSGKCVPTSYFRIYGKENDCRFTLTGGYALVFSYDKEEFIYKKLYY